MNRLFKLKKYTLLNVKDGQGKWYELRGKQIIFFILEKIESTLQLDYCQFKILTKEGIFYTFLREEQIEEI